MKGNKLTAKQEKFCQLLVDDPHRNQTKAAIAAGYSKKSARQQASENMTNPDIRQRIKELEREAIESSGYSIESLRPLVMRQLVGQMTTDVSDIVEVVYEDDERRKEALKQMADANGGQSVLDFGQVVTYVKPTSEWTPEERAAVKGIKWTKEGLQIETYDKQTAARLIADIAGMTKQSVEIAGKNGGSVEMNVNHSGELSLQAQVRAVLLEKLAERTEAPEELKEQSEEEEYDDGS